MNAPLIDFINKKSLIEHEFLGKLCILCEEYEKDMATQLEMLAGYFKHKAKEIEVTRKAVSSKSE